MLFRGPKMTTIPSMIGSTGHVYHFRELIQERAHIGRVWLATTKPDDNPYVLKDIPEAIFSNFNENIRPRLCEARHIRLPVDQIPDQPTLVYEYLTDDFHSLIKAKIVLGARKKILKAVLKGLAELHARDVVHLDIKSDNILVNCQHVTGETFIENTLIRNESWRSPEGHLRGELNKPSDIFSFGIMCIHAVLGRVIFALDDDFEKHEMQGALPYLIHLQRQVCFFGDESGIEGLVKHIGDDQIHCQALRMLWEERNEDYIGYSPFRSWPEVEDEDFKDLVGQMMSLDPARRNTVTQALEHPCKLRSVCRGETEPSTRSTKGNERTRLFATQPSRVLNEADSISTRQKESQTYSSRDSHVVTHRSTNLSFNCLCMAERTGCPVLS
ncbi:calcium/calmodulin dependent protein kinase, partial [Aureobasidium melanogenum]